MIVGLYLIALAAAVACYVGRLRSSALLLFVSAVSGLAAEALAPLRAGAPVPYEGRARALWFVGEIITAALPPAVALACAGEAALGALAGASFLAAVAVAYPAVRGPELLRWVFAYYVALYLASAGLIIFRAVRRAGELHDELALLCFLFTGIASVLLLWLYGPEHWAAVQVTYGVGVVAAGAIAARRAQLDRSDRLSR